MANHKSAEKAHAKSVVRAQRNKSNLRRIKTFVKKLNALLLENKYNEAQIEFRTTQSEIFKGVTKGIFKKNTAARHVSRLAAKIKKACVAAGVGPVVGKTA